MLKRRLVFFVCLGLLLSACSEKPAKKEKTMIRLCINAEPPTLDPRKGADVVSSTFHFMLFEGLVRLEPDGSITPAQAKSIDISEDKKSYTFHLRDTCWTDGSPVTAYDFEKSWKDILDPNFPAANAHLLYPIKNADNAKKGLVSLNEVGIRAIDAKTLFIELDRPTPYFLELIAFCVFFPVNHTIDATNPTWLFHAGQAFTSNGYYRLKKWTHHAEIVLEKNPTYWNPGHVKTNTLHFSMIDNETTALQLFQKKELDILGHPLVSLPSDALPKLKKEGAITLSPCAGSTFCAFNTTAIPFSNKHMRKAFALAINRTLIVNNITGLDEEPALGAIPLVLKRKPYRTFYKDNDLEMARRHFALGLSELGLSADQLDLTYLYTTSELEHKIAQALQQQWNLAFGIHVKLENVDNKILLDKLAKRTHTFGQTVWYAQYTDQMNLLERYRSRENVKNYSAWEDPTFISLLDESFHITDPSRRLAHLEEAEARFAEEMPLAVIYHKNGAALFQPHLKNIRHTPLGNLCFEQLILEGEEE